MERRGEEYLAKKPDDWGEERRRERSGGGDNITGTVRGE